MSMKGLGDGELTNPHRNRIRSYSLNMQQTFTL